MIFDREKFVTTLSAIFIIVIFSSTNVQGLMNNKLRKQLVENPYVKHSILLISIYTTKSYEIIHMGGNFQKEFTHEIPIEKKIKEKRISFTFRYHKN